MSNLPKKAHGIFQSNDPFSDGEYYLHSQKDGIVAGAGGGQGNATRINSEIFRIITAVSSGDSVMLPPAVAGTIITGINDGANAVNVFADIGSPLDTINGTIGTTAFSIAAGSTYLFTATSDGVWKVTAFSGSSAPSTTGNIVANIVDRGGAPAGAINTSGSNTRIIARRSYICRAQGVVAGTIQIGFCARSMASNGEFSQASFTVAGAAIEINGVTTPITFSGANSAVVASNGYLLSDPIPSVVLSKNQKFWIRTLVDAPTAYVSDGVSGPVDQGYVYNPVNENNQIYNSGNLTSPTGAISSNPLSPAIVVASIPSNSVSYIGIGDSISVGLADIGPSLGHQNGGMIRRFTEVSQSPLISYSASGKTLSSACVAASNPLLSWLLGYASCSIQQLGTNDITNGATFATMQSNLQLIWATIKSTLVGRKYSSQLTLIPRVTSTDGMTTYTNQTPSTGFALNGVRHQCNFYYRTANYNQLIDTVVDISKALENPSNRSQWGLRPFTTTLAASFAGGASISLNDVPEYGECLVTNPTTAPGTGPASVWQVSGTSAPFTITLWGSITGTGSTGNPVASALTYDGTHPGAITYEQLIVPKMLEELVK